MSGVRSLSHELIEEFTDPIDHLFCMAGGGGFLLAVAQGFEQLLSTNRISKRPRLECVQPQGNNTIAGPLRAGSRICQTVESTTRVSGLQVPQIIDGNETIAACLNSGGSGHVVSDEAIFTAQARLAIEEGIFSEPAGATAVAGVLQAAEDGLLDPDANIICIISGSGFKDPASLEAMTRHATCPLIDIAELEHRVVSVG